MALLRVQFSAFAIALALAGCGGSGGGGAPSPTSASPAVPTLNIVSDFTDAIVAEPVSFSWQSSGVSTCSFGGDLSGSAETSGSRQISRSTPGTIQITLTCTGVGGTTSAQLQVKVIASTRYSVSTVQPVAYPDGYLVPTRTIKDINTDPCNLNVPVQTFPQAWITAAALPRINGAPLPPNIRRGISIKDIMLDDNPGFILPGAPDAPGGCRGKSGTLQDQFDRMLARIQSLNAEYIILPQWHWAVQRADGAYEIKAADATFGPLSDRNLTYLASAAHQRGLKVILFNQIQGLIDTRDNLLPNPPNTLENYQKWFAAFRAFMVERSVVYQRAGIDVWDASCNYCILNQQTEMTEAEKSLFSREYKDILARVRVNFQGRMFSATPPWFEYDRDFIDRIDIIYGGLWSAATFTQAQSDALTVSQYKATLNDSLGSYARYGKTMIASFGIQSRRNALSQPGYLEETACTSQIGDLQVSTDVCLQKNTETDFALQAKIVEAQLEYAKEHFSGDVILIATDYFVTDYLIPQTAYPNLGYSIRNKPAEGIVRAWFARP